MRGAHDFEDGKTNKREETMELEEAMAKLTDRMQIKREHGVTLLQTVLNTAGTSLSSLFRVLITCDRLINNFTFALSESHSIIFA